MNFDPSVFWHYLFYGPIVDGAKLTLIASVVSQALGIIFGLFLALARLSRSPLPIWRWLSGVYIWLFRGTPLLVQLLFVYDAIPQMTGERVVLGSITSAIIALSLNEGAYMAEIIRAGIQSVDPGQVEAAKALGMTYPKIMRRIVLPQALRFVIPPTGNEFISMLKNTSLASVISAQELLFNTQQVYSNNYYYFELLSVASIWYLAMTSIATWVQSKLERRAEYRNVLPQRGGLLGFALPGMHRG